MNPFALSGLLIVLSSFPMGIFVLFKNPRSNVNRLWSLFTFLVAIWGFGVLKFASANTAEEALFWWRAAYFGVILIPVVFMHFVYVFVAKKNYWLIFTSYILGLFFIIANFSGVLIKHVAWVFNSFYYAGIPPTYLHFFMVQLWFFTIFYSHIVLYKALRHSSSIKRNQIKFFFLATAIGFTGGSTSFFPFFGINVYPYGNFTVFLYPLIMTYAIVKYRLMDIDFVIKKTMTYSLSAGMLTALFVVLVLSITRLLSSAANVESFGVSIFAAILIAVLFNPLRKRIQTLLDTYFFRKNYDYYAVVKKVSSGLAETLELQSIYELISSTLLESPGVKFVSFFSLSDDGVFREAYTKRYVSGAKDRQKGAVAAGGRKIEGSSEIVRCLTDSREVIVRNDLKGLGEELTERRTSFLYDELSALDAAAVVPITVEGQLSLLMLLGNKLSEEAYKVEDISLLGTIADQMSIAVKNARMYSEKVRTERLASIGMMSATFAHEIRNPLTSLKTFAQLMPEKYNDEEFRTTFSKIVEGEIEKIDDLIKDLLDFSSGSKSARVNSLNLVSLVDETVEYVRNKLALEQREIKVERVYEQKDVHIMGDASTLKQAFINIISNGCQAMNGNGELRVEVRPNMNKVDVSITDNGEGIPPERISNIFDPFVTSKERGMGLGLAISKRVIEEHNGNIKVTSRLNEGSTFTVSLPLQNGI